MTITMAITITTPTTSLLHSSSSSSSSPTVGRTSCLYSLSSLSISIPKNAIFQRVKCIPQLGFTPFPQWSGLKQMGFSILPSSFKIGKKGKGKGVCASLFGVGAPEVLVIGVVALLVFGPKGLAEVARNLGKTLREFQPTIRELQEVSREFKSTLEREIGLDDIDNPAPKSSSSDTAKPKSEDAPADPETKIEPNGSSGNEEESGVKVRADSFLGALAQLQKEQAEEEQKKIIEKENEVESETSQSQPESQMPSPDTPEALDDSQEVSSVTSTENPDNNALQEADSVTSTASDNPENNALQEAAPMVATGTATNTEIET